MLNDATPVLFGTLIFRTVLELSEPMREFSESLVDLQEDHQDPAERLLLQTSPTDLLDLAIGVTHQLGEHHPLLTWRDLYPVRFEVAFRQAFLEGHSILLEAPAESSMTMCWLHAAILDVCQRTYQRDFTMVIRTVANLVMEFAAAADDLLVSQNQPIRPLQEAKMVSVLPYGNAPYAYLMTLHV